MICQKEYPLPNECGVYDEKDAKKYAYKSKLIHVEAYVLEIKPSVFISSLDFDWKISPYFGSFRCLSARDTFTSEKEAILNLSEGVARLIVRDSFDSETHKTESRKVKAWFESISGESFPHYDFLPSPDLKEKIKLLLGMPEPKQLTLF